MKNSRGTALNSYLRLFIMLWSFYVTGYGLKNSSRVDGLSNCCKIVSFMAQTSC